MLEVPGIYYLFYFNDLEHTGMGDTMTKLSEDWSRMTDSEKERYRLQSKQQYFAYKPWLFKRGDAYAEEVENLRKLIARGKEAAGAGKEVEISGKDEEVMEGEESKMLDWKKEVVKLRQKPSELEKRNQNEGNEIIK